MNKKTCLGCGAVLQDQDIEQEGYTLDLQHDFCQRCFRIRNYGEYTTVSKSNDIYIENLKRVNQTNDLVLHLVDLTSLDADFNWIHQLLSNPMILVLNKRDALPKSVKDEKLISYFKKRYDWYLDIVVVSSKKQYNMDLLYQKIRTLKTSRFVYLVGYTNVGKSSLVNQMIRDFSVDQRELTISPLPSTTLDELEIQLDDSLTLIDTPGLVNEGSLCHFVESTDLKRLQSKKEMKPRTFQMKPGECLFIDSFVRIDYVQGEKNSFTCYLSNAIPVQKRNGLKQMAMKELSCISYDITKRCDLAIDGLGWIKIVGPGRVFIYVKSSVHTFLRDPLI